MKTIARVYDSYAQASQVVADLKPPVPRPPTSTSSPTDTSARRACAPKSRPAPGAGAGIGAALGGTAGLLAGLGMIAIPGLGPVVAAGALAATAGAAAGAATGGVVGALVASGVPECEAQVYCEAVRRGGTMVSVRTSEADEPRCCASWISIARSTTSPARPTTARPAGRASIPKAEPYTPSQAEIERLRRPYARG